VPWRDLDLPAAHPGSADAARDLLAGRPAHWLGYYDGTWRNLEGGPASFVPGQMSDDQLREVNAKTHVMNELIDEAIARVLRTVEARGWRDDTDIIFTTDHGELQGDFGLLFKGPFHCEALMRLPMIWCPAPSAGLGGGVCVTDPVGQVDLAPTFCAIAGIEPADWMQGDALPQADGEGVHQRAICEWDSQFPNYGHHLRSIYRDGWVCTAYEPSTGGQPNGLEAVPIMQQMFGDRLTSPTGVQYDGTEGELYNVIDDPHQFHNLWDDAGYRQLRDDLVADLYATLDPLPVRRLPVEAPA
jgi:arylsulfatase A-like enzyme